MSRVSTRHLTKAHVLRLNTKICPVFTANTNEAAFGRLHKGRAASPTTEGGGLRPPPSGVSFVLVLNKAHVLGLNTAHVLRLNKVNVLALNKAHVLRHNTKICPVFTANTKEAAFGRLYKGGVVPKQTLACCGHHQHQPK